MVSARVAARALTAVGLCSLAAAQCPNLCNQKGMCNVYGQCECFDGWRGGDCTRRACPVGHAWQDIPGGTDAAHAEVECSGRGTCTEAAGRCLCDAGFGGQACERLKCKDNCNDRGSCYSMRKFADRYFDAATTQSTYNDVWDADMVYGCVCDPPYYGYDCSQRSCPHGDDPLSTGQAVEVQLVKCTGTGGSFILYFNEYVRDGYGVVHATPAISHAASAVQFQEALTAIPAINDVTVTFFTEGATACTTDDDQVASITFTQNFGDLPPLMAYTTDLIGTVTIATDGSYLGGGTTQSSAGTKENVECADHGLCATDGACECQAANGDIFVSSDGLGNSGQRGDCGFPKTQTSNCPGDAWCSGHGVCDVDATWSCACSSGWTGADCSLQDCPTARSWFSYPTADEKGHSVEVECSAAGICDPATGECSCNLDIFTGGACEFMACPGSGNCFGHGECLSMAQLALAAEDNGEATDITYGLDPNNAHTWDAHRVLGCLCDDGYTGHDCKQRTCPLGDDPGTYDDVKELQLLQCKADGGTFTLEFRQAKTWPIPWNATSTELEWYIEALATVTDVEVAIKGRTDGLTPVACDGTGESVVEVVFVTEHADVPALVGDTTALVSAVNNFWFVKADGDTLTANAVTYTSVAGTTENVECSNRGTCDRATGLCVCFKGYASGDGQGGEGNQGDCGYQISSKGGVV